MTMDSPWTAGTTDTRMSISGAGGAQRDATVLRQAALGDIEPGNQLDARGHGRKAVEREVRAGVQHAVDAVAHFAGELAGFNMDVGRALVDGLGDQVVDEGDDGSVLGHFAVARGVHQFGAGALGQSGEQALLVAAADEVPAHRAPRGSFHGFLQRRVERVLGAGVQRSRVILPGHHAQRLQLDDRPA